METRLLLDKSTLKTDAGRDDPRAGGVGAGSEIAEGELNGVLCEWPLTDPGLLEGGGGGALALSDLGRFSFIVIFASSSALSKSLPGSLLATLDFDTIWLCRRVIGGAGAAFFLIERVGEGERGSGRFPAASLSNIDSRSES